jgi:type IV pilus assembly protein PilE
MTPRPTVPGPLRRHQPSGFTLLELMVSLGIAALLAAIAIPGYSRYVNKSRAKGACSDLVALSMALENYMQKSSSLTYPALTAGTPIAAKVADRTAGVVTQAFTGWSPAEGTYYTYTVSSSTTGYTFTATAQRGSCTLTIDNVNNRGVTGNDCGFTSW